MKRSSIAILILGILILTLIDNGTSQIRRMPKFPKPFKAPKIMKVKQPKQNYFKELELDLEAWIKDYIFPEMELFKDSLDSKISINDLKSLDSLRNKMGELNKQIMETRFSKDKNNKKEVLKTIKKEKNELLKNARPLRNKYFEILDSIYYLAKPKIPQWEDNALSYITKWIEVNKYELKDNEKKQLENLWKFDDKIRGIKFLLWDGKNTIL